VGQFLLVFGEGADVGDLVGFVGGGDGRGAGLLPGGGGDGDEPGGWAVQDPVELPGADPQQDLRQLRQLLGGGCHLGFK
jgi:hypothetical protein